MNILHKLVLLLLEFIKIFEICLSIFFIKLFSVKLFKVDQIEYWNLSCIFFTQDKPVGLNESKIDLNSVFILLAMSFDQW